MGNCTRKVRAAAVALLVDQRADHGIRRSIDSKANRCPLPVALVVVPNSKIPARCSGGTPGPAFANVDEQSCALGLGRDNHLAAIGLGFHGVAQKIIEGLAQARGIDRDLPRAGGSSSINLIFSLGAEPIASRLVCKTWRH